MSRVDPYCFDQPEENPKGKKYVCAFHFDDDYIIRCIKTEGKLGNLILHKLTSKKLHVQAPIDQIDHD